MLERARGKRPLDWGIAAAYLIATCLMLWATTLVDWWSTATSLFESNDASTYAPLTVDGQSLANGYYGVAGTLILLVPLGWMASIRNRPLAGLFGLIGVALTVVATQLDSPVEGLVPTNAWIPAAVAWLFYFGALVTALSTQGPQLELDPSPDSSDG